MKVEPLQFLTTEELAVLLGGQGRAVSPRTIRNWRSYGQGPRYIKIQSRVMYPLDEVQRWLQESAREVDAKRAENRERARARLEARARGEYAQVRRNSRGRGRRLV